MAGRRNTRLTNSIVDCKAIYEIHRGARKTNTNAVVLCHAVKLFGGPATNLQQRPSEIFLWPPNGCHSCWLVKGLEVAGRGYCKAPDSVSGVPCLFFGMETQEVDIPAYYEILFTLNQPIFFEYCRKSIIFFNSPQYQQKIMPPF